MHFRFIVMLCLGLATALHAQEVPSEWDVTVEVNQLDPTASDTDATTPFKTIKAAAQNALGFARAGRNVRVLIHPGVYRESVMLRGQEDEEEGWIKFEGTEPGKVILNGSRLVTGWSVNDDNAFEAEHGMPNRGGLNRPTLFVEGARLLEAPSRRQVKSGQVFWDDDKLVLLPPRGGVITDGKVEMGELGVAINAKGLSALYVENLSIERGYAAGLSVNHVNLVVVNNTSVEYCQFDGVLIADADVVRIRRLIVERCGQLGLKLNKVRQVAIDGSEANVNGWAARNGDSIAERSGVLLKDCHSVKIWTLKVVENQQHGFWLENSTSAALGKITAIKNKGHGAVCLSDQPEAQVTLSESEIAYNEGVGVRMDEHVTLIADLLYGNDGGQVQFKEGGRITRNIIVGEEGEKLVFAMVGVSNLEAGNNLYYAPGKHPFQVGEDQLSFAQWQERTRQDLNSFFGEPKLVDPAKYQFTPHPSSPWFDMREWPERKLD